MSRAKGVELSPEAVAGGDAPPASLDQVGRGGGRLSKSMSGPAVNELQGELRARGYPAPDTGKYDAATERAVKSFQRAAGQEQSGAVTKETVEALRAPQGMKEKLRATVPEKGHLKEKFGISGAKEADRPVAAAPDFKVAGMVPAKGTPEEAAARIPEGALAVFAQSPAATAGTGVASGALQLMVNHADALKSSGFKAAGENAIGLVSFPRYDAMRGLQGKGPVLPESGVLWGHTALYARVDGKIQFVKGFGPDSLASAGVKNFLNDGAVRAGLMGVKGVIRDDSQMLLNTAAKTLEYPVTKEMAEALAKSLPHAGELGPHPYTAVPATKQLAVGKNCVLWAVDKVQEALGGNIGPLRDGKPISPADFQVKSSASQGRLHRWIGQVETGAKGAEAAIPKGAAGAPVAASMPLSAQVMRWGGRAFTVLGVASVGAEIAMAKPEERGRTATGAVAGFAGGMAAGAAAGLVCGPGAPVCSLVLGMAGGVAGSMAARAAAEGVYDAVAAPGPKGKESSPVSVAPQERQLSPEDEAAIFSWF